MIRTISDLKDLDLNDDLIKQIKLLDQIKKQINKYYINKKRRGK